MYKSIIKFVPGLGLAFTDLVMQSDYGRENFVFIDYDQSWEIYATDEDEILLAEKGLENFRTHKKFSEFREKVENNTLELVKEWKQFDDLDLQKLSTEELVKLIKNQKELITKHLGLYHTTEYYYFAGIEKIITESISSNRKASEAQEIFGHLLSPLPEHNILTREQIDRYKLAIYLLEQNIGESHFQEPTEELDQMLVTHLKYYDFLPFGEGSKYLTKDGLIHQLKNDMMDRKKLQSFLAEQAEKSAALQEKQQKLDHELDPNVLELVKVVRSMQEFKYHLRIIMNKSFFGSDSITSRIFREISRLSFYSINQIEFMTFDEIIELVKGNKLDLAVIRERQSGFICLKEKGKYKYYSGEKAANLIKKIKPTIKHTNLLRGSIANPGQAKGTAKLIRLTTKIDMVKSQIDEMKPGQILVSETTGPELIIACQKAAAIVTNEGGINSHAAIVSRELKIPCVIGTKIATDIIKNGDLIEVNADTGEINIIERSNNGR